MAGVSHPGSTSTQADLGWDLAAPFIGLNGSGQGGAVFNQWTQAGGGRPEAIIDFPQLFAGGGTVTAAGGTGNTPAPPTAHPGDENFDAAGFGQDWFETVHLLPKTKIEFGNIISQLEDEYELYSSYRKSTITETAIVNNAAPGVELPNNVPPVQVPPQTSILDPTTTGQTTSALGTLVKLKVVATPDGLPTFDTNIDFDFSTGDTASLLVSGTRIVLIPQEYEAPTKETLAFLTDIIDALDGKEQRIALRTNPRQIFEVTYLLDEVDRQRMQLLLMDWMDNQFGFPLWHEQLRLTAPVSIGATVYPIAGGDDVDLRVGGLAVVITDANTFDVINITAKSDTSITANDPSSNAYPAGTKIMPLRTAVIRRAVGGQRYQNNLEEFRIAFEVTDNDTGALAGDTTPGFWSLYNGRVLFDDCNVVPGNMDEQYVRRVVRIDNETGVISQVSSWDKNKRLSQKGFVARSRAEVIQLRKVLLALRGRQKAFYLPTFIEDVTVKADLVISSSTMDIERLNYPRFAQDRHPKKIMRVTFTDDTSLVRVVQSSVQVDNTTDRLTLDTTWPSTKAVDEVARVEFYELSRFDTDNFQITYPRIGLAQVVAPVRQVFDDD